MNKKKIPFPPIEKTIEETRRKQQQREKSTHESFAKKKKHKEITKGKKPLRQRKINEAGFKSIYRPTAGP